MSLLGKVIVAEQHLEYITSIEELGIEKGRRKGAGTATRKALLQILEARCGPLAEEISRALHLIRDVPAPEQLASLAAVCDSQDRFANTLADLEPESWRGILLRVNNRTRSDSPKALRVEEPPASWELSASSIDGPIRFE